MDFAFCCKLIYRISNSFCTIKRNISFWWQKQWLPKAEHGRSHPSSFHHNFWEWDKLHLSPDRRMMPWGLQPSPCLNPSRFFARWGCIWGPSCNWPMRHWLAVLINKSFCAAAEPTFGRPSKGRPSGSPSSRGMDATMHSSFSSTGSLLLGCLLLRWK